MSFTIFLDIDGVLNHEDWYVNHIGKYRDSFKEWWEECFDPECVKRVKHILEETGAKIVISSSWRFDPYIKYYFEKIGLPLKKYLRTPNLHTEEGWPDRGEEIDAFLKAADTASKKPEIDYIHGADEVLKLSERENTVGILLPPIAKDSFFETINGRGPLPRKSFSMGEADEKRFYLECRKLF